MINIDMVFNSQNETEKLFQIASGHISKTAVLFEQEGIVALIDAKGSVDFYCDDKLIATESVPVNDGGREVYEQVKCQVSGGNISIGFAICEWIDNYPNCDGEHDRWDSKIIGYHTVNFNK